jgi:hypothetical protein
MIRSKIIPAIVAAFCGLALQFQASGANAQEGTTGTHYQCGGGSCTNLTYATASYTVFQGSPLCSPYWGNCLIIASSGFMFLIDWQGNILWQPAAIGAQDCTYGTTNCTNTRTPGCFSCYTGNPTPGAELVFQSDGNFVLYAVDYSGGPDGPRLAVWRTGTTNYNGQNDYGYYVAIQDDGNFVIYDYNWIPLWAAQNDPTYNTNELNAMNCHFKTQTCGAGG